MRVEWLSHDAVSDDVDVLLKPFFLVLAIYRFRKTIKINLKTSLVTTEKATELLPPFPAAITLAYLFP